jgi:phytoene/squalene synthetase
MQETYFRLLRKIERQPEVVFRRRVQLSWQTKLWLAARATLRL